MKKVCVSFKELYFQNGAFLENGGYIDFYSDDDNEYYDLRTDDVEKIDSELLACDGEQFNILSKDSTIVILQNVETLKRIYLSPEEYSIAVFEQ